MEKEPLISGKNENGEQGGGGGASTGYEYIGRFGYGVFPTAFFARTEVSIDEIHSAALISQADLYPPSLHTAQGAVYQEGHLSNSWGIGTDMRRQVLDEVGIRELLLNYVGHHFCWGSRPAKTWKIHAVEDCNVYVGTLETFIEERNLVIERQPNIGGKFDGKEKGPEPGLWELDLRSEFPALFVPHKESRTNSEATEICSVCLGKGQLACPSCNGDKNESGSYKQNQMTPCRFCRGNGRIVHSDESVTICPRCNGEGKIPCATCGSHGLIQCETCKGGGSLLLQKFAVISWRTLTTQKVRATSGAASVPDEVFNCATHKRNNAALRILQIQSS